MAPKNILLEGKPGIGKTTLIHSIADQLAFFGLAGFILGKSGNSSEESVFALKHSRAVQASWLMWLSPPARQ